MVTTNKYNLPSPFVRYNEARNAAYSRGKADISVTQLIDSPRIRLLREAHAGELTDDVIDSIWALFGTAVHVVLDKNADPNDVTEQRLSMKINGWVLGGGVDHQKVMGNKRIITDYKVTSVWSVMLGSKQSWVDQQNCYAELVENETGDTVTEIRICAMLRDWSRREASYKKDYPQTPVVVIDLPLWKKAERIKFLEDRVALHQDAQADFDKHNILAECKDHEKWAKPDSWALMKGKNKRATKVFTDEAEANTALKGYPSFSPSQGYRLEHRQGENTRCDNNYCGVSEKCPCQMEINALRVLDKLKGSDDQ